jgi:hypothetical protein
MRAPILASALAGATLLAGCGGGAQSPPTVTVTKTVEESGTTAPEPSTSTQEAGTTPAEPSTAAPEIVGATSLFSSPTGNIGCAIDKDYARCDIAQKDWDAPSPPASCPDLEYGDALEVSGDSAAAFACHGDTTRGSDDVLEYGDSIQATRAGVVVCTSSSSGMTCENTDSGHGFFISRQSYKAF